MRKWQQKEGKDTDDGAHYVAQMLGFLCVMESKCGVIQTHRDRLDHSIYLYGPVRYNRNQWITAGNYFCELSPLASLRERGQGGSRRWGVHEPADDYLAANNEVDRRQQGDRKTKNLRESDWDLSVWITVLNIDWIWQANKIYWWFTAN